jgi:hypothetical protein
MNNEINYEENNYDENESPEMTTKIKRNLTGK